MIVKYLKQTGKHSIVYGLGNLVSKIIAFLLIPIYTRVLSTEEYGILSLMTITLTIAATLLSLSLHTALFRFYIYDYTTDKDRKNLISTIIITLFVSLIIIVGLLIYFSDSLSSLIFNTSEYGYYLKIIFLASFFEIFTMISLSILRAQSKSKIFSVYVVLRFIVQLSLILYFVVFLNQGVLGALKGLLFAFIFSFVINLPILIKNVDYSFSVKKFKEVMRFSIPLVPAALSIWIMTMIDRFILERIHGSSVVGVYTLGYNIGMAINFLFVAPIQLAWAQIKWSILKKENTAKEIFGYIVTYYILLGTFLIIGQSLLSDEIIRIISSEKYYSAAIIIPYVAVSYLLFGIYFMINLGINIKKRTELIAIILIVCAVVNIFLNYLLIPKYSMMGAAAATVIAYILLVIITYFVSNYFYKIKYQWFRLFKIVIAAMIIFAIDFLIPELNIYLSIVIKIVLSLNFFVLLWIMKFFEKRETDKINMFLKQKVFKRN